ncbi:MAG TPA: hypothetical protein VGD37_34290 [Kofleriaceae bacterium]
MDDHHGELAAVDGDRTHVDCGERRERALDSDTGKGRQQLIVDCKVCASAVIALTDDDKPRTMMTCQIIGERADRPADLVGQRLLALDAIALVPANQRQDLLVGHPARSYAPWDAQAISSTVTPISARTCRMTSCFAPALVGGRAARPQDQHAEVACPASMMPFGEVSMRRIAEIADRDSLTDPASW